MQQYPASYNSLFLSSSPPSQNMYQVGQTNQLLEKLLEKLIIRMDTLIDKVDFLIHELLKKKGLDEETTIDSRKRKRRKTLNNSEQEINVREHISEPNNQKEKVIIENLEQINQTLKTISLDTSKNKSNSRHYDEDDESDYESYQEQDKKDDHPDWRYYYIN